MQRFECTTGGSNKFYEFETVRTNGRITVNGYYGAIGRAPSLSVIYDGDDVEAAQKALDKKIAEKLKHRYLPVGEMTLETATPPRVITEELPIIWPMAAQGIKTESEAFNFMKAPNYYAQEKLDGMRAIVHITKTGLRIFSRSAGVADPTRPLEKTASIPHLAALRFPDLAGTILDGELMSGKPCSTLSGEVNSKNGANASVKFFCFDVLRINGQKLTGDLERRVNILQTLDIFGETLVYLPYACTTEEKEELLNKVLAANGEGLMFKNIRGGYCEGGRPSGNWYKLKKSSSWDCVIMGFTKGEGKFNDSVGAVVFGQYVNGTLTRFGQTSGMNESLRKDMSIHPEKYLGRVIIVKGQERLKSGAIRHPQFVRFNDEKQPVECIAYRGEQ